ncbi:MAG TPA: ester cyclase [Longimicrobiales bacterium]|nr:ester cyclase [Longimicrobiales bacterium]
MGDQELRQLARDSVDAFNQADWDRWRKLHASNIVYEEIATGQKLIGHDEILTGLKAWREAFPDLKGTVKNLLVGEDQAVVEVEWSGTQKGNLMTPFGTIPPSGRSNVTRAMLVLRVEKDRIVSDRHYFDFYGMLRKLGALPETLKKAAGA